MRRLTKILKRLVAPEPHGMYHSGDLLERLVALRYSCQRSSKINQKSAIDTLKLAVDRYQEANKRGKIASRQFAAIEAFANNKIAEYQGVNLISKTLDLYSIRSIPFDPCQRAFCATALIGVNRRDWLRNIGENRHAFG